MNELKIIKWTQRQEQEENENNKNRVNIRIAWFFDLFLVFILLFFSLWYNIQTILLSSVYHYSLKFFHFFLCRVNEKLIFFFVQQQQQHTTNIKYTTILGVLKSLFLPFYLI